MKLIYCYVEHFRNIENLFWASLAVRLREQSCIQK